MSKELKKEHVNIRKQLSIMKEDLVIKCAKMMVEQKMYSKEDMNDILESLMRIEFRFDITQPPAKGMMNFNNVKI